MKILLFIEATLGGTTRHILDLTEGLLQRGHEVHLAYSTVRADRAFIDGLADLRRKQLELRCKELKIHRAVGLTDIPAYLQLSRYVRSHGPFDIWHAHSTKAGFLLRLVFPRSSAAVVYTSHGLMTLNPALQGLRRAAVCILESSLARLSDVVVSVSQNERACAIKTGIPPRKLAVINNGLHPARIADTERRETIRTLLALTPETICIGWVGLLVANKEPFRLLEAIRLLKQKTDRPIKVLMIGWGPEEGALRTRIDELGLAGCVQLMGQTSSIEYLPAFDILAHTSRYEGFGYIFLEALAAGIPVVTTRVGGADETLPDGSCGAICDPWDTSVFAEQLRRFAEDSALRTAAAPLARARAAQFDVDSMVDATVALYQRILKAPAFRPLPNPASPRS